jgi:tripeptide aminopeptidase
MNPPMSEVLERFMRYVRLDSASVLNGGDRPTSPGQSRLADLLESELAAMAGPWATMRLDDGSLLVRVPGASGASKGPHSAFLAHLDTYYGLPGAANPRVVDCDGRGLALAHDVSIPTSLLAPFAGKRLVVSDGSGLLGADDKAGVAALMTVLSLIATERRVHGPVDFWFTTDEEIGRIGVDALPEGVGESWDILWTVDGEDLAELSVGDLAIRRARVVFSGIDAHPCLHGKDLVPAHYAAARFADRLADLPNPMTSEGRTAFYQMASREGSAERAELFCRFASFDGDDLDPMEAALRGLAMDAAAAYGAHVAIEVTTGSANFREAVVARPDLVDPARGALAKAGYEASEIEIRGGTDGGLLAVSFPGLAAPDLGTGARNLHSRGEFLVVDELESLPGIILDIIESYQEAADHGHGTRARSAV